MLRDTGPSVGSEEVPKSTGPTSTMYGCPRTWGAVSISTRLPAMTKRRRGRITPLPSLIVNACGASSGASVTGSENVTSTPVAETATAWTITKGSSAGGMGIRVSGMIGSSMNDGGTSSTRAGSGVETSVSGNSSGSDAGEETTDTVASSKKKGLSSPVAFTANTLTKRSPSG